MPKKKSRKNPAAVALGRLGGKKSSPAKKAAARRNILKRWARYRAEKTKGGSDAKTKN